MDIFLFINSEYISCIPWLHLCDLFGLGDMVMSRNEWDMQTLRISTYDLMDALFIRNIASDPASQAKAKPRNTRKLR